jgi:biotin synthase
MQALCFLGGANSIFYGEKLLTTGNPDTEHDQRLFRRLKIAAEALNAAELPHAESLPHRGESFSHAQGASVAS